MSLLFRRRWVVPFLVAAVVGAIASPIAAADRSPIVVGAILSITGLYAPLGEPERNALMLAQKEINAHGGVGGRPIRFTIEDDEGKADTASQLATGLIGQNVAALIGGSLTPTSSAIARVAGASKIVQFYMTPTQTIWNAKTGVLPYVFETTPRNELEADRLLDYSRAKLGSKRFAVLHDDAPYGEVGAAVVASEAKRLGIDIVDDEAFPITATDVTAQLGKIKASGADTVLIWTASPTAAIAVRQIVQLGLHVRIMGSTGIVSDNFLRVTGKDGDGVYSDMSLDVTHPSARQAAFLAAYREAYRARPSNFASFAWDAAHLAALALAKTHGNRDGDAVANALLSMPPYRGTTGTFNFTASDHNGVNASDINIAVDRGGVWFTL